MVYEQFAQEEELGWAESLNQGAPWTEGTPVDQFTQSYSPEGERFYPEDNLAPQTPWYFRQVELGGSPDAVDVFIGVVGIIIGMAAGFLAYSPQSPLKR